MIKPLKTIAYVVILLVFAGTVAADTLLHSVTGYTSSYTGIVAFSALAFDADGRITAVGDDEMRNEYECNDSHGQRRNNFCLIVEQQPRSRQEVSSAA